MCSSPHTAIRWEIQLSFITLLTILINKQRWNRIHRKDFIFTTINSIVTTTSSIVTTITSIVARFNCWFTWRRGRTSTDISIVVFCSPPPVSMIGQVCNIFVHLTFDMSVVTSLVPQSSQADEWRTHVCPKVKGGQNWFLRRPKSVQHLRGKEGAPGSARNAPPSRSRSCNSQVRFFGS